MERVVAALGKVTEIATCGSATPLRLSSSASSPSFSHHSVKCIFEGQNNMISVVINLGEKDGV